VIILLYQSAPGRNIFSVHFVRFAYREYAYIIRECLVFVVTGRKILLEIRFYFPCGYN